MCKMYLSKETKLNTTLYRKVITAVNEKQMQRLDTLKRTHGNTLAKVESKPLD